MGFIAFHAVLPAASVTTSALLVTFLFVALLEELYFRDLLQNLLKKRIGHPRSLFLPAVNLRPLPLQQTPAFNWRYVLLATIAGLFCGRAWGPRHRLLASSLTHTLADVVWGCGLNKGASLLFFFTSTELVFISIYSQSFLLWITENYREAFRSEKTTLTAN